MDDVERFAAVYAFLASLFNAALLLNGEVRVDAYVSVNILSYYISYALFMRGVRATGALKAVSGLFLLVFLAIVALRVYEVLWG